MTRREQAAVGIAVAGFYVMIVGAAAGSVIAAGIGLVTLAAAAVLAGPGTL